MSQNNQQEIQDNEDKRDNAEAAFRLKQAAKLLIEVVLELALETQPKPKQAETSKPLE